jgi:hypothetical protein
MVRIDKLLSIALGGTLLLTTGSAATAPSISVAEAIDFCEAGFAPPEGRSASSARRHACLAYIDGVIGTVAQIAAMAKASAPPSRSGAGLFCIPADEPYERLSNVFTRFARSNPQFNDRAAAAIFVAAFAAAYPCD